MCKKLDSTLIYQLPRVTVAAARAFSELDVSEGTAIARPRLPVLMVCAKWGVCSGFPRGIKQGNRSVARESKTGRLPTGA